jgi:hypothetical protein
LGYPETKVQRISQSACKKDHPNQITNAGIVVNLDINWMDVPNLEIKLE